MHESERKVSCAKFDFKMVELWVFDTNLIDFKLKIVLGWRTEQKLWRNSCLCRWRVKLIIFTYSKIKSEYIHSETTLLLNAVD